MTAIDGAVALHASATDRHDCRAVDLAPLAGATTNPTPPACLMSRPDHFEATCVWVVRGAAFDGDRWRLALARFMAAPANAAGAGAAGIAAQGAVLRKALERLAFASGLRKHRVLLPDARLRGAAARRGPLVLPLEKPPKPLRLAYPLTGA